MDETTGQVQSLTLTAEPTASPDPRRAPTTPRPSHRIPYEPALDGLRGLAVGAVVLYHGGVSWLTGGFLGVDAFFVLSGYLITALLLGEWFDTGTIALRQFWMRRIRRLLPALLVVLALVALWAATTSGAEGIDQLRGDGIASLFYVMNWRLVATSQSYFFQFSQSPLLHTWSLAIEEQYYLVWPLVVLAVTRIGGAGRAARRTGTEVPAGDAGRAGARRLLIVCGVLFAASAAWMAVASLTGGDDPSRLYYGTDTRAQSLLIGSALAAALAAGFRLPERLRTLVLTLTAAVLVALAVAWCTVAWTAPLLYRGGFTLAGLGVAVVVFTCTQLGPNPIRRALSFEPLRLLGLISYGLYLYHFPINVWLNPTRTGLPADSLRLLLLRVTVALVVATASYVLVERPIRGGAIGRLPIRPALRHAVGPVAVAVVLVLVLAATTGASGSSSAAAEVPADRRPAPAATGTRVLLVGDSVAYRLGVGFEGPLADELNLSFWNQAVLFCELIDAPHVERGERKAPSGTCSDWAADWEQAVTDFRPDVAVLEIGAWEVFDREIDGRWIEFGTPEFDALLLPKLGQAIDALSATGAPVVVLTTPRFERDDGMTTKEWTPAEAARTDHFNDLLRQAVAASDGRAHLVDLGAWLCPDGVCTTTVDGIEMRPDGIHFSEQSAAIVAGWLAPQLVELAGTGPDPAAGPTTTTAG